MSGGSYDYICYQDQDDIRGFEDQVLRMADRLAGLGYADDAAKETHDLVLILRQQRVRVKCILDRLCRVWKAVEWWDSHDSDEEFVKTELKKYRGET